MKLNEIYINDFGRLHSLSMELSEGFQLVYGPNEQGKSTIMAFMRVMLYGLSGTRRQLNENDRRRYMPWESGKMGGYMVLTNEGTRYRLERQFGRAKAADTIDLMNDISGRPIDLSTGEEPGFRLLGITENEFVNTVYVSQLSSTIGTSEDLLGRLSNLAGSGDTRISHLEVAKRLRQAQVSLVAARGTGGRLNEARKQMEELHADREKAVNDAVLQEERLNILEDKKNSLQQRETEINNLAAAVAWQEKLDFLEKYEQMRLRQEQIAQGKLILDREENTLKNADFQVNSDFVRQGFKLEQNWQNSRAQLEQAQQQVNRSKAKIEELEKSLDKFKPVAQIEHNQFKKTSQLLIDQQRVVEKIEQELKAQADEKTRQREKDNAGKMAWIAEEISRSRQKLQNTENEIKIISKDMERLREQDNRLQEEASRQREAFRQQAGRLHDELQIAADEAKDLQEQKSTLQAARTNTENRIRAMKSDVRSGRTSRQKGKDGSAAALAGGAVFLLAGAAGALLINPLFWMLGAAGFILLIIGTVLVMLKKQDNGFTQEIQLLESELRITENKYQSLQQMYRYTDRNRAQISQQLERLEKEEQEKKDSFHSRKEELARHKDKMQKDKTELEQQLQNDSAVLRQKEEEAELLQNSIMQQEPIALDNEDSRLQIARQQFAESEKTMHRMLSEAGYDSAEQLSSLLQEEESLQAQMTFLHDELTHDENEYKSRQEVVRFAGTELITWLRPYIVIDKPEKAALILEHLREQVEQVEKTGAEVRQQEQAFADRLDDLTWEEWQDKANSIIEQIEKADPSPVRLESDERQHLTDKLRQLQTVIIKTREEIAALETEIRHFSQSSRNVSEIDEQLSELEKKVKDMENYYNTLEMTSSALDVAAEEMQSSFGPALNQAAAENLAKLTHSRYEDLKVDQSFAVRISDPDTAKFREWQYLSGGTIDQVYLALRLAIADQISSEDNRLPLLLDDILIQYDEERAAAAIDWLMAKSRQENQQMLLFTCQERMVNKVKTAGLPVYNILALNHNN